MAFVTTGRRPPAQAVVPNPPMRGLVPGLPTPRPIGELVPAALQEDDFCQRLLSGLDEVLAPIFNILDCFDSYIDPKLAPPDFVDWLGSWVGVDIDETWSTERRRQFVQQAVVLYRIRGTLPGLAAHIRLYCGVTPEIDDNGGCSWSQTADTPLPGSPDPRLNLRLVVDDADAVRRSTVARIVDSSRPAHLAYTLEILVGGKEVQAPEEEADAGMADEHAPGAVDLPGSEHIELAPQSPVTGDDLEAADEATPGDGEPTA